MNQILKVVAVSLAVLCCQAPPAQADPSPTRAEFARIDQEAGGRPRALQLAIVNYVAADGSQNFSVDLIGAVHIADQAYYHSLNERFREYDVLLYELVVAGPGDTQGAPSLDKGLLTRLQIDLKDALGLAFQLDEIDYSAANFVHADLSTDMLLASMQERGESLYVYFWRIFYSVIDDYAQDPLGLQDMRVMAQLIGNPEEDAFKVAAAHEMVKATQAGDILGSERGSAIIEARNLHALEVLKEQLAAGAKSIGIFYGAAHMVDFDRRLTSDHGLRRAGVQWVDAWLFDQPHQPDR